MPDVAVLVLAFGGPEKLEDVRPFIGNVVSGRNVPAERVELVVEQYKQIGGKSPFNELTARQVNGLTQALNKDGCAVPVYTGFLFWHPFVKDTARKMQSDGVKQAVAIVMAAHRTEASYQRYVEAAQTAMREAAEQIGGKPIELHFNEPFYANPLFIEAIADRVVEQLDSIEADKRDTTTLIFSAHSVPSAMSDQSGYAQQVEETAAAVARLLEQRLARKLPWSVGFQSRSGPPNQPWLEPDIAGRLQEAKDAGYDRAIVIPVGFLCDHVEVLYDLDVLAAEAATKLGMIMLRAQTVGDHPKFVGMLASIARNNIESVYAKPERK